MQMACGRTEAPTGIVLLRALNAAALGRTAAVVRNRRYIGDFRDLDTKTMQCPHRRLATRTGPLDPHFEVLHAVFHRHTTGRFGSHLRRERRRLARTLEAL